MSRLTATVAAHELLTTEDDGAEPEVDQFLGSGRAGKVDPC